MKAAVVLRFCSILVLLLSVAGPGIADTFILDGDDVLDWTRAFGPPAAWRAKDACMHPNSLFKFDLSEIPSTAQIARAELFLYVERSDATAGVSLWHVPQQNWLYGRTRNDSLYAWPADELITTRTFTDTTAFSVPVTSQVAEELLAGSHSLSLKITAGNPSPWCLRISSPLAPIQRMRPRLRVETIEPLHPLYPDFAVSTADIRFSNARPSPGQTVTIYADVRNIGEIESPGTSASFYDGQPPGGVLIGTALVPGIAKAGGVRTVSVNWSAKRGVRDIYVVVDQMNLVVETDETNNTDFRQFWVTELDEYENSVESFEQASFRWWQPDFDVPGTGEQVPRAFYINRSAGQVYHGDYALELFLDGRSDDGTIWIERSVPVNPNSTVEVNLDWEFFRYFGDMAFFPKVYVGVLDPERESDFTDPNPVPASQPGWTLVQHSAIVNTGPYDRIYLAIGLTVTWETPGTFYFDLVHTRVRQLQIGNPGKDGTETVGEANSFLLQPSFPNPSHGLATIGFQLERGGPVSLQIYDMAGRRVKTLLDGTVGQGFHQVRWDGTDDGNRPAAAGVYTYRLESAAGIESRKLLLIH